MLLGSASSLQRFGVMYIKALGVSQLSGLGQTMLQLSGLKQTMLQLLEKSVLQLHVTALFNLENSRKIHPRGVRACRPKDTKKRVPQCAGETPGPLAPLYIYIYIYIYFFFFFFLPLGLSYVNWASQEHYLFYLRSSLWSSDLRLFYFCRLLPSLSFSHCHSGLLFPILTT